MDPNNESKSPETLSNFDDFNNMFKGIDCSNCVPGDVAHKVFEKVKREHNQSRFNDVCEWIEGCHFYRIKRNVSLSACVPEIDNHSSASAIVIGPYYDSDESEVSDIED